MKVLYTAVATAHGGRDGLVDSSDGKLSVTVSPPVELGGAGAGTNPEQLFAAGFAACFHSALGVVARRAKADTTGSTVTADVDFGANGVGGYTLGVRLTVTLPALTVEEATKLAEQADAVCPYSNATRGNISVTHTVIAG